MKKGRKCRRPVPIAMWADSQRELRFETLYGTNSLGWGGGQSLKTPIGNNLARGKRKKEKREKRKVKHASWCGGLFRLPRKGGPSELPLVRSLFRQPAFRRLIID